ncbi:MAG: bifunctional cobalt-precorrin-7 ((5))-methyltransferase/cobalt-precorrin-6B [Ilumatobacteraceae bacterium]|nr:bifunctional cobalt-precorrin-7 ((5))-methyltransferase/cobalt-precorrin-6B [Ilumatobacteraceae bacterium]
MSTSSRITVVGSHGGECYGEPARRAVRDAAVIVGSTRHLRFVDVAGRPVIEMAGGLHGVLDQIGAHLAAGRDVAVISSGDPGFFGIVRLLAERFGRRALDVHPAPSSVSLAFARIGATWDDAVVISAHGRPSDTAIAAVVDHAKVAVLTAPLSPPQSLGQRLVDAQCAPRDVVVATRLGEPDENVVHTDLAGLAAGTFDPMSIVVFLDPTASAPEAPSLSWGLPEHEFAHRNGMITKSEVRAVALGKLDLPVTGVLWDIGAGSGSVAIECARLRPRLRVFAVERDAVDAERIRDNARTHGVSVTVVTGSAPDALADLPTPDRVFIGGGGIEVLDACLARLGTDGTVVATHVIVDRASESWRRLGNMVQLSVSRGQAIADGVRLEAQNPVFVTWGPGG